MCFLLRYHVYWKFSFSSNQIKNTFFTFWNYAKSFWLAKTKQKKIYNTRSKQPTYIRYANQKQVNIKNGLNFAIYWLILLCLILKNHCYVVLVQWKMHINIIRKWWLSFCLKLYLVIRRWVYAKHDHVCWIFLFFFSLSFHSWDKVKWIKSSSINACYVM